MLTPILAWECWSCICWMCKIPVVWHQCRLVGVGLYCIPNAWRQATIQSSDRIFDFSESDGTRALNSFTFLSWSQRPGRASTGKYYVSLYNCVNLPSLLIDSMGGGRVWSWWWIQFLTPSFFVCSFDDQILKAIILLGFSKTCTYCWLMEADVNDCRI